MRKGSACGRAMSSRHLEIDTATVIRAVLNGVSLRWLGR